MNTSHQPNTTNDTAATAQAPSTPLDVEKIRADFPILQQEVRGKSLVYLDNAASGQRPKHVIEAIKHVYEHDYSNIHRGVHTLSQRSTQAYEDARVKVQHFINAESEKEIVFTRGTTEAINLVAHTFGRSRLKAGDEVLISTMEHHSNIVPWQILRDETGIVLKVIPINEHGAFSLDDFRAQLTEETKLVSVMHVSNALGTVNPIKEMTAIAHERNIPVLVDGAQAIPHLAVDVQDLGCDFYAFSAHKMCGPTGVGVLYGKFKMLKSLPPYQGGGDMIESVTFEKTTYAEPPARFEAGTPNIVGGIALGAAIDYLQSLGMNNIAAYEHELLEYGTQVLSEIPGLRIVGTAPNKASVISFVLDGIHPHDLGTILDNDGVAIRTGHHCAQPVMDFFKVPATARASFAFYNTKEEIDRLAEAIRKAIKIFQM